MKSSSTRERHDSKKLKSSKPVARKHIISKLLEGDSSDSYDSLLHEKEEVIPVTVVSN